MTKNKFRIPSDILSSIRERDTNCAYCHKSMVFPHERSRSGDSATIEHLNREGPFYWADGLRHADIVICCGACNSSRGVKLLQDWFDSPYCTERAITALTVSEPVRNYLARKLEAR